MLRDIDRQYHALMDQLQDAFDDELRLRTLDRVDQPACRDLRLARERIQALSAKISAMLGAER